MGRYEVRVVQRVGSVVCSAVKMGEIRHHAPITYDKVEPEISTVTARDRREAREQ